MHKRTILALLLGMAVAGPPVVAAPLAPTVASSRQWVMPYAKAGLSKRDAAVHLLNRFTFGPENREAEVVVYVGLEKWFDQQLEAAQSEADLEARLRIYPSLSMSDREIATTYLDEGQRINRAVLDGGMKRPPKGAPPEIDKAFRQAALAWARDQGLRDVGELRNEMMGQKLVRAVYAKNQLREVLTDFWFNHFNVSFNTGARPFALSYERDAIRPQALGPFLPLLLATAKHPAMLAYLNNNQSVANADEPTTVELLQHKPNPGRKKSKAGLNENYGREVMELHTLGVDGGYTQTDVTQLARALTGWTYVPIFPEQRKNLDQGKVPGAVVEGDFLFRGEAHDAGAKTILGRTFPQGGGLAEGEAALAMLATHPSTARFVSRQLAVRFVSDTPPDSLVKKMAQTFQRTGGDTREVLRTMVKSPEFWAPSARQAKIKSPFELVASSLRALDADVVPDRATFSWIDRMGQPLYTYAPPTGYPDRASAWVNSGTLTHRMNYSLTLTAGRIKGLKVDLTLLQGLVPLPPERELERVGRILLPGRDLGPTLRYLGPLVNDPNLMKKVDASGAKPNPKNKVPFSQIVGVLIGSPEFQRR